MSAPPVRAPLRVAGAVPAGPGEALEARVGSEMARAFGHDFSRVRVHRDAAAAQAARALDARAYSVGQHVVFGEGRYAPESRAGKELLAHELAHVVQGADRTPESSGILPLSAPGDGQEREAHDVARKVAQGERARPVQRAPGPRIARTQENGCTPARMRVTDPDSAVAAQIAILEEQVRVAIFTLRGWLDRAWYIDDAVRARVDFFFDCPSDARVGEIVADLERLHALLTPSFPYHCRLASEVPGRTPQEGMESIVVLPYGRVPTGVTIRNSHFRDPAAMRDQILGVGLRMTMGLDAEILPYGNFVREVPPGVPTCQRAPDPARTEPGPAPARCFTPAELDLDRTRIVYFTPVYGILYWDAEPRGGPMGVTRHYEWQLDQAQCRVFVVRDGRRVYLLPNRRTQTER